MLREQAESITFDFLSSYTDGKTGDITKDVFSEHFCSVGADSVVYKTKDGVYVLKFYTHGKFLPRIVSKDQLLLYMETTNRIAAYCNDRSLSISGLPFRVNPILAIVENEDYDCGINISHYIDGDSYLLNPNTLTLLSGKLADLFRVDGISIMPLNVRVLPSNTLMVTDLCSELTKLKKRK